MKRDECEVSMENYPAKAKVWGIDRWLWRRFGPGRPAASSSGGIYVEASRAHAARRDRQRHGGVHWARNPPLGVPPDELNGIIRRALPQGRVRSVFGNRPDGHSPPARATVTRPPAGDTSGNVWQRPTSSWKSSARSRPR